MVSSSYRITEPHPSVPTTHYIHSGRGGAGNISHVDPRTVTSGTDASGPASRTTLGGSSASAAAAGNPYYLSGRGGAGNMHYAQERPIFSFDEELERQRKMMEHQAPVYHIGRGGAGNYGSDMARRLSERSDLSDAGSHAGRSAHSVRNSMEGAWTRIRGSFSKTQ